MFPASKIRLFSLVLSLCSMNFGCHVLQKPEVPVHDLPHEKAKVSLPPYVIEPPDILTIDAVRLVPLPPYKIGTLDVLTLEVTKTLPNRPVSGLYTVDPDGSIDLGFAYGLVNVDGKSLKEAKAVIKAHLNKVLNDPEVTVGLAQTRAKQEVRGPHLVRPDGTVGLATYGSVHVAGLTLDEAKKVIEAHLSKHLLKPEVALDVFAYNSKVFYVITDGGGYGEQVISIPLKGNETVLDALSQVNGLSPVSSRERVWIARPTASATTPYEVLPVDYASIARNGSTATNYQVLPGDRIYVQALPLVTMDTMLSRIIAPIERILGVTLLGSSTVQHLKGKSGSSNGGGF